MMTENLQHRSVQVLQLVTVVMAIVLVFMAEPTSAGFTRVCDNHAWNRPPQGVCGNYLTRTVDFVCESYNNGRKKRSLGVQEEEGWNPDARLKSISVKRDTALSYLNKRTYETGTINCECCAYQCTYTELVEYCHQ